MCNVSDKSLGPAENERLREILRELVDTRFKGNKSLAARELKVSQSFVSEVVRGTRGGGNKLLGAIADYTGRSLDDLAGRKPRRGTRVEYEHGVDLHASALGKRHDFPEAREDCELRYGKWLGKHPGAMGAVESMDLGLVFERLDGDILFKLAEAWVLGQEREALDRAREKK